MPDLGPRELPTPEKTKRPRDEVERCSKALFGNYDFVVVAIAIANSDGLVNATDLEKKLNVTMSRVRAQLLTLESVGLLYEHDREEGGGKRWYLRQDSSFWHACRDLQKAWSP